MEHRHVQCPGCGVKLRLTISEKDYGKTVEITCSKCGVKCRTTIPPPAAQKEPPHGTPFFDEKDPLGIFNFGDFFGTQKK